MFMRPAVKHGCQVYLIRDALLMVVTLKMGRGKNAGNEIPNTLAE